MGERISKEILRRKSRANYSGKVIEKLKKKLIEGIKTDLIVEIYIIFISSIYTFLTF